MLETPTYDALTAKDYFDRKLAFTTGPVEVNELIKVAENVAIVDVRELKDYRNGHLPGALSLPKQEWDTFKVLRKDAVNIVYCYSQTCHLAAQACARFAAAGFRILEMEGGFEAWKDNDLPVEQTKDNSGLDADRKPEGST